MSANKCPRCGNYYLGDECYECGKEIEQDNPFFDNPFGDIFNQFNTPKEKDK